MRNEVQSGKTYSKPPMKRFAPPTGVRLDIMRDFLANPNLSMAELAERHKVTIYTARYQTSKMLAMTAQQREEILGINK